jgi:hypothetical protein
MEGVQIQIMAKNVRLLHEVGLKHWLNISNLMLLNIHPIENHIMRWN